MVCAGKCNHNKSGKVCDRSAVGTVVGFEYSSSLNNSLFSVEIC